MLEGRRGKEDGLIFVVPLPTVLQSALEELTWNIFGHIFSKTVNFSMLTLSCIEGIDFSSAHATTCFSGTTEQGDFPTGSL